MRLQKIKIEGYRSLKSVVWEPAPLNVLIGANASGKSNFLHALELLPAAADGELEKTILRRGGMAPLMWDGKAEKLYLEADFRLPDGERPRYALALNRLGDTGSYDISVEKVIASSGAVLLDCAIAGTASTQSPRDTILSSRLEHPVPFAVQQVLRSWSIHHDLRTDQSAPVRQSAVTRHEKYLAPDGQNLIPVLHTLYEGSRNFEEQVDNAMSAAFPNDYEKLKFTPLEDGRIQLRLRWKHGNRLHTAADLSDGTLRFLMLLAILANPDPPLLIAIDEPEMGLHPGMLPIIAEFAVEASNGSQVILSTHSPEMLDAFRDTIPAVTVFQWVEDHTELKTLSGDDLKSWVEDYSLGKFAFSGEAEALS